jgi:hypothetical protein
LQGLLLQVEVAEIVMHEACEPDADQPRRNTDGSMLQSEVAAIEVRTDE